MQALSASAKPALHALSGSRSRRNLTSSLHLSRISRPLQFISMSHRPSASTREESASSTSPASSPGIESAQASQDACGSSSSGPGSRHMPRITAAACVAIAASLVSLPAAAVTLHAEPANALSLPTWAIHVSSVLEWTAAMVLVWRYANVSGNQKWKGLTWGMMPLLGGALCACTHHIFYNDPQLDILVALQAFLTFTGNATCWWAAARIYKGSRGATSET